MKNKKCCLSIRPILNHLLYSLNIFYENMKNRIIEIISHKPMRTIIMMISLLCFGLSIGIYAWISLGEQFDPLQFLDLISFTVLIAIIFVLLPRIPEVKTPLAGLIGLFISLSVVGFVVYHRFYQSWPTMEIYLQWRDLRGLGGSFKQLIHSNDIIFGLFLPSIFMVAIIYGSNTVRRRPALIIMAIVLLISEASFELLAAYPYRRDQNQPMMYLLRDAFTMKFGDFWGNKGNRIARVDRNVESYYPTDTAIYRYQQGDKSRLRKVPVQNKPKRSFKKMNVLIVMLESVRAYESSLYGAPISFTPNLDNLGRRSLVFSNFYGNGSQTVRGELAVLCSFYENLKGSPIYVRYPKVNLSCLPSILKSKGYQTLWISTYTASYSNKKGFLQGHGIQQIHDLDEFKNRKYLKIGWGPSDEDLYAHAVEILDKARKPFFAEIMSLSNHHPFTWPYPSNQFLPEHPYVGEYANYLKGVFYTDYAVGKLLEMLESKPWFQNTILVVLGDHGIWLFPRQPELTLAQKQDIYFRLSCIIHTPSGIVQPGMNKTPASQVDLAPTILDILGLEVPNGFVGRSLLRGEGPNPRYVLMLHDDQWNIRQENAYCYDLGRECFFEHIPWCPKGYKPSSGDSHSCFYFNGDLMQNVPVSSLHADPTLNRTLLQFGKDIITYNKHILTNDMVYREPKNK